MMPEQITISKLEYYLTFFNKMYDAVRLVDPVQKKVLKYDDHCIGKTSEICYDYWENGNICNNCISVRAHYENKSYMKIEQNPDAIMLVTALPVEAIGEPVILELLKNATDSMMIGTGNYNDGQTMHNVIFDLNNMVIKDPLTSIYNRRFVDDRLPVDIIKATIAQQPLSVVFIDVDNMKTINDTYGHISGDLALKHVANAIQNCIRADMDWTARYGGDEFIVCLNNIGADEASHIAERIRKNIMSIKLPVQNRSIKISASLGIQTMLWSELTAEEIIRMADEKMYEEKRKRQKAHE
jgi:two-component system cell cycle response regulator